MAVDIWCSYVCDKINSGILDHWIINTGTGTNTGTLKYHGFIEIHRNSMDGQ